MKLTQPLLLSTTLLLCFTLTTTVGVAQAKKPYTAAKDTASFTYKIIAGESGTYGYGIYRAGKLMVHQPSIPALPGNRGFNTKTGAQKVAGLVIWKIQKGEMPPTISIEEMQRLKAL